MNLSDVAADVFNNGKSVAIVGPVGSGKSTVLRELLTRIPNTLQVIDLDVDPMQCSESYKLEQLNAAYQSVDADTIVVADHGSYSFGELLAFKYPGHAIIFTAFNNVLDHASQIADILILTNYEAGQYTVDVQPMLTV